MPFSKEYRRLGLAPEVQLGKKGGKIKFNGLSSGFSLAAEDGVTLLPIKAGSASTANQFLTKSGIETLIDGMAPPAAKMTGISLSTTATYDLIVLGDTTEVAASSITVRVTSPADAPADVSVFAITGPVELIGSAQIDSQSAGIYTSMFYYQYPAGTNETIRISVTANGATTGTVDVLLEYDIVQPPPPHWSVIYTTELASYTNQIYVSTTGNDTTGTGAIETPYLTVAKAVQMAGATGTAILVEPGTYLSTASHGDGIGGGGYTDSNKAIGIFGKPNSTLLTASSSGTRDVSVWFGSNANTRVYGVIFRLLPTATQNSGAAYQTSFFSHTSDPIRGRFYNCAFYSTGSASTIYSNPGAGGIQIFNCSFNAAGTASANYSGAAGTIQYSTAKAGFSFAATTTVGNLIPNTFGANWHATTNDSTVGVWSGPTYWSDV